MFILKIMFCSKDLYRFELSGKDNPFADVGSKEYSMKELLVDEKPEGNIQ